jgi:Putative zinc-finger
MTVSGLSGPTCREIRQLLGVYVVGAIDPSERSVVDEHLGDCAACRDELAGLAGLPAMLGRVPVADVERMVSDVTDLPERAEPSPELLNSLLRKVSARRRSRMWRGAVAVAAAAVVAAGGATAISQLTTPHSAQVSQLQKRNVASGMNPANDVAAVVDYTQTPWNTTDMRVQVSGIAPGTICQFYVIGSHGKTKAGSWTVGVSYGDGLWYAASAPVKSDAVHGFQIISGHQVLLTIPVSVRAS